MLRGNCHSAGVQCPVVSQRVRAFDRQKAIRRDFHIALLQIRLSVAQRSGRSLSAIVRVIVAYQSELMVLQMLAQRLQIHRNEAALIAEKRLIIFRMVAFRVVLEVDRLDARVLAFRALIFRFLPKSNENRKRINECGVRCRICAQLTSLCRISCLRKTLGSAVQNEQNLHVIGFSPVCCRKWISHVDLRADL